MNPMRLDVYLVEHGFEKSRERAKALITAGAVKIDGTVITKPAYDVSGGKDTPNSVSDGDNTSNYMIEITDTLKYVSRGGYKLEFALKAFNINANNTICIDIGASTGGFTDCLLQHGAKCVYAVDVGTDQLDPKLKSDSRVVSLEQQNILSEVFAGMSAKSAASTASASPVLPDNADIIVCDVSFISVTKILPRIKQLMSTDSKALVLIKPQFEIKSRRKNGVVRDKKEREKAVQNVTESSLALGLSVLGVKECPVNGKDGNVEYFMLLSV
jgi:23S rRNA (cytidine1920-2'-O)/16S rRNA (cytidine1409-2'-O)-methyltransferase